MRKFIIVILMAIYILSGASLLGQKSCDFDFGDSDCDGIPLTLADLIAAIGNYRGTVPPCYFCDCGVFGQDFPVSVDQNGNCVPFELADIVAQIAAYRGAIPEQLCPGCYNLLSRTPEQIPEPLTD